MYFNLNSTDYNKLLFSQNNNTIYQQLHIEFTTIYLKKKIESFLMTNKNIVITLSEYNLTFFINNGQIQISPLKNILIIRWEEK